MRHHTFFFLIILTLACIQSDSPVDSPADSPVGHSWEYQTCGSITLAPVVKEDRVYFFSHDGWIYCLHALTGELLWRTELKEAHADSVTKGNTTLLIKDSDMLYAFDLLSGDKLWELSLEERIQGSVVAEDIYLTTKSSLFRVREKEGTIVWNIPFSRPNYSEKALFVIKDKLLVEEADNALRCYTIDGDKLWEFHLTGYPPCSPWVFVEDDALFLSWRELYKIDIETGELTWVLDKSDVFHCAIATEKNLILKGEHEILCLDRETTEILWERIVEDFSFCFFGVLGDTLYLTEYRPLLGSSTDISKGALIVQEQDGEPLLRVEGCIFAAAVGDDKAVFSTEEGVACFDGLTGKQLWNVSDIYPCRGMTLIGDRAYIASDDGKIYSSLLNNSVPFSKQNSPTSYSEELGDIESIHIEYFLGYCISGLITGEVHLLLQDDEVYAVEGYEEQLLTGEKKNLNFEGKINKDVVEAFYESINDLYVSSYHADFLSTIFAEVKVKIQLENGEVIMLKSGSDMESLMPWHVRFRGRSAVQYTGSISVAFDILMSEVGWDHHHAYDLHSWGVVTSGLCLKPVNLLEL